MQHVIRVSFGTILLLVPLLVNGEVFLYFDTASYLSRPAKVVRLIEAALGGANPGAADAIWSEAAGGGTPGTAADFVVGGRSVFYGAAAWLAAASGHVASLAVLQAAATAAVLSLLWSLLPRPATAWFLLTVAALAVLTPAGFFAALITPDAFAPLVILAAALLACAWPAYGAGARAFLVAVLAFGLLSHTSHLLIASCMVAAGAVLARISSAAGAAIAGRGLACCAGAILFAGAASVAVDTAAKRLTGFDVISRPHLTAHLVDDGPGAAWAARHCEAGGATTGAAPGGPFAVCAFADRLPADWIAFLFSRSPANGAFAAEDAAPTLRRALSEEDLSFALTVLRDAPLATAGFLASDAAEQLFAVRYDDVPLAGGPLRERAGQFPFGIADGTGGRLAAAPGELAALSEVVEFMAAAGGAELVGGLILLGRAPRSDMRRRTLLWVAGSVLLGVVLNAAVCGALASPYDRFQSRVIFLIPALAAVVWAYSALIPVRGWALTPPGRQGISS